MKTKIGKISKRLIIINCVWMLGVVVMFLAPKICGVFADSWVTSARLEYLENRLKEQTQQINEIADSIREIRELVEVEKKTGSEGK